MQLMLASHEWSTVKLWTRGFNTVRMNQQWNMSLIDSESCVLKTHNVFN